MAVTTTYSLIPVRILDIEDGQSQSDAASLAEGGFAAIDTHAGHIDGKSTDPNGDIVGSFTSIAGTDGAISQLLNGNLVVVSQDSDSILFKILDPNTSGTVVETVDLNDSSSSNPDVAGLSGGGFVIVNQDAFTAPDHDIDVTIRNSDGSAATSFTIDSSNADDENASVAALGDGEFAVAWQRNISGTSQIWYAVYNSSGGVVKAPTLFDSAGSVNANPSVAAAPGGFVIAYEDNGFDGDIDIALARFDRFGVPQDFDKVSDNSVTDSSPYVVALANGMLVVSYAAALGDNDVLTSLIDDSGAVVATRAVTAGESIFDEQIAPSLATLLNGQVANFWTNTTDNDIDGELLEAVRTSIGDTAADTIIGDFFRDEVSGGGGNDTIDGSAGNDTLDGDSGRDAMTGGAGDDTYYVDNKNDVVTETLSGGAGGADTVFSGASTFTLGANVEDLTLIGANNSAGIGNALANRITGNAGNNSLQGLDGDDTLTGGDGADDLRGGGAADRMNGGKGNDRYFVDDPGDQTIESNADPAVGGIDTVFSSVTRTLGANLENLRLQGGYAINGTGNGLNNKIDGTTNVNILKGLAGNDTIDGKDGADTIDGGEGNDTLTGGSQSDVFRFPASNAGVDRILDFNKNGDRFDLSGGSFTALSIAPNGDAVLTHNGGAIRIANPPALSLSQWNALVLPVPGHAEGPVPFGDADVGIAGHPFADFAALARADLLFA